MLPGTGDRRGAQRMGLRWGTSDPGFHLALWTALWILPASGAIWTDQGSVLLGDRSAGGGPAWKRVPLQEDLGKTYIV